MACSVAMLQARAGLYHTIRQFFAERGVMEVDTPLLSQAATCDVQIDSYDCASRDADGAASRYLQTSPEFAMKRLLASGVGAIYQIAHAFRSGEAGRYHNPEFSILEWYRPGFDLAALMDEVRELLQECLGRACPVHTVPYVDLFQQYLGVNPHLTTMDELATVARTKGLGDAAHICGDRLSDWLDLLFSQCVQPKMRPEVLYFVHDYPVCQAMLAKIEGYPPVAQRFEVFFNGVELANGFDELADATEQRNRFENDRNTRSDLGKPDVPMPEHLLAALESGLPASCGVAIGLDRLLMLASDAGHMQEVLAFPWDRA